MQNLDFYKDLLYDGYMAKRRKNLEQEINRIVVNTVVFMESYNKNLPTGFRVASRENLDQFYKTHPLLFKHGRKWSIDKHRKRVMDWLATYHES